MSRSSSALLKLRSARLRFSLIAGLAALLLPAGGWAQTYTFSNSGTITMPNGNGDVTPSIGEYPVAGSCTNAACIDVSGLSGSYISMSITLTYSNVNIQSFADPALLLVSPDGTHMLDILSYGCGLNQTGTITFTLEDSSGNGLFPGSLQCPDPLASNYQAAHYTPDPPTPDNFPSPGPGSSGYTISGNGTNGTGTGTFSSVFGSLTGGSANASGSLNGTWKLYAVDQGDASDNTEITSWSLKFNVTGVNQSTTTSLAAGNPSTSFAATPFNSVAFTATVTYGSDLPVSGGTVTFYDNTTGTNLGTEAVSSGMATLPGVTFSTQGTHVIYAVYNGETGYATSTSQNVNQTVVNHATESTNGGVTSFCNEGPITLSSDAGGNPYPSMIVLGATNISGDTEPTVSGTIESVSVTLNGISLTNYEELDNLGIALQAPGSNTTNFTSTGNAFEFLSFAGNPYTSGSLTFSDDGSSEIPYDESPSCTDSTCLPTDDWVDVGSDNLDAYPSPGPSSFDKAPPTGSASFLTEFGGGGVSGTWSLYVDNRLAITGAPGSIGSWCLNFTTQTSAHPTSLTVNGSANPASFVSGTAASVNLAARVAVTDSSGLTVDAGTVTFVDGTTNLGSAPVSNGSADLANVALSEGTHQIVASYSGTSSGTEFGVATGKFDERVNKATANPTSTEAGQYSYCNTGAITAPGLGEDSGAAYPYPSNIFVTNLPGTVKATSITLNGFNTKDQGDLMSLLVGPSSNSNQWNNNFDFFSLTGSSVSVPSTFNLTFADGGTSIGGNNLESTGTYAPESNEKYTFPQCGQNASDCGTENVGPPLGSGSTFTPTNVANGTTYFGNGSNEGIFGGTSLSTYNGNGTWSLYLDDGGPLGGGEATNVTTGWCMNFTENPVTVSATASHHGSGQGDDFVVGEQGAQITVGVENEGTGSTGDPTGGSNPLTVTDTLASGLSYAFSTGAGWSCSASGQTVTCTNDSAIAQSASYPTLTINVNVAGNAASSLNNSVSVSGAGVTGANSSTDTITVDQIPSLAVALTHSGTFTQGQNAAWEITVSNSQSGSLTSGSVTVSDTLPSGYMLYNYSGTGWFCGGTTTATCTSTMGVSGGSSFPTLTLTVSVPANSPTSVSNTVAAYGGGDTVHNSLGTAAQSNTDTVTVAQVPASVSILSGNSQAATVNTSFSNPLVVVVEDGGGNTISGASVTFTAPGSGASGTFSNSSITITATTNASGQASETFTSNTVAGSYAVTATAGSGGPSTNFSLTNTAGVPTAVNVVSGSGQSAIIGQSFSNPLVVLVTDTWGNALAGVSVTFTAPGSGASATLSSGNCTTVANGTCSVTATANGTAGGPYTVSAPAGAGTSGANFSLTNNPTPSFVVNNAGDSGSGASDCPQNPTSSGSGSCTLRDAVSAAEAVGVGNITFDSSVFSSPHTINLGSGAEGAGSTLAIGGQVNIQGPGAGQLTIAGDDDENVGSVVTVASGAQVYMSGLTISGGYPRSGSGGGINNQGTLTLANSAVSGNNINSPGSGAGIDNSGTLTLTSSTVSGNSTIPTGGSGGGGGGIFSSGTLMLIDSTVTGNSVGFYSNGGGGGIFIGGGTATIIDSTVFGNSNAQLCPIPSVCMGGPGGGINNAGTLTMWNSIVAGNTSGSDADVSGAFGTASANNLIGDGTGMSGITNGSNSNQVGTSGSPINPQLTAAGGYGGQTETMVPLPGSAAICAGSTSAAVGAGITSDQRGVTLNAGGYCASGSIDAGAVQTDYTLSFTAQPSNVFQNSIMNPAPVVTLDESGAPFTASPVTIPLSLASSPSGATLTGGSVATSAGLATYSGLSIDAAGTGDTLTATLVLNPAITPTAPALTATSGTFNVAPEPPFGAISPPEDAVTSSATVTQGDSVLVTGWAADVHDGAPISSVSISIDGNTVGNATLGIAKPGIATEYGSRYLDSGWTYTYTGSLATGTHTVKAVLYDSLGLSTQLPTKTFTVSAALTPPYGALSEVVDAVTKSSPVGQSDGLLVTGWAADLVQGAPVSQVTVSLDGTSLGNATLNVAGPSGEPANSGWIFTYTGSALTAGTHTVSVMAYDSGGRSATLGSRSVTVQANTPPFGEMTAPEDATTNSAAVTQGDSVLVTGWAADVHDGAPVHQVSILIDGTTVGNATLGIARTGIATEYGSAYLDSGWTYTYTGSLAVGTHTMTAVLYDSLGLSTQLPTKTFTVSAALTPPYGALSEVVDAVTKSSPVGQSDGLLVTGWAADLVQGAPVSQVTVSLDGTSLGNATLNVAGPSGEPANSGWIFTYTGSALTAGTHTVSVVAYDSGSRSATLGSRTITVQASVPPFGGFDSVVDATTKSTTVTQGDSVLITGWAADVTDGAPISRVSISIDGNTVGNATLGIAKPGIATIYGSRYLHSGWTYTYSGTLTNGTHTVTAVFYASGGRTRQLSIRSFTVSE